MHVTIVNVMMFIVTLGCHATRDKDLEDDSITSVTTVTSKNR